MRFRIINRRHHGIAIHYSSGHFQHSRLMQGFHRSDDGVSHLGCTIRWLSLIHNVNRSQTILEDSLRCSFNQAGLSLANRTVWMSKAGIIGQTSRLKDIRSIIATDKICEHTYVHRSAYPVDQSRAAELQLPSSSIERMGIACGTGQARTACAMGFANPFPSRSGAEPPLGS